MLKEKKGYYTSGELLDQGFEDEDGFNHGIYRIFNKNGSFALEAIFIKNDGWNGVCKSFEYTTQTTASVFEGAKSYCSSVNIGSWKHNLQNGIKIIFNY